MSSFWPSIVLKETHKAILDFDLEETLKHVLLKHHRKKKCICDISQQVHCQGEVHSMHELHILGNKEDILNNVTDLQRFLSGCIVSSVHFYLTFHQGSLPSPGTLLKSGLLSKHYHNSSSWDRLERGRHWAARGLFLCWIPVSVLVLLQLCS